MWVETNCLNVCSTIELDFFFHVICIADPCNIKFLIQIEFGLRDISLTIWLIIWFDVWIKVSECYFKSLSEPIYHNIVKVARLKCLFLFVSNPNFFLRFEYFKIYLQLTHANGGCFFVQIIEQINTVLIKTIQTPLYNSSYVKYVPIWFVGHYSWSPSPSDFVIMT